MAPGVAAGETHSVRADLLASIPSPGDNAVSLGPLELRAYGLAIALGVLAALRIAQRRFVARGGDPEVLGQVAAWAVPAGLVGARLYHVLTDYQRFQGDWWSAFAVWEGGLGIPGGLLAGVATGVVVARRKGLAIPPLLDVVAPALPVAQAIGRLGNWFNQELFGRPSDLPWAVRIDPEHRPRGYESVSTFHPTFAYEACWNLLLAGLLVIVERRLRPRLRRGQLFVLYVGGYALGRLWVESLRIDPANEIAGWRVNTWVSLLTLAVALAAMVVSSRSAVPVDDADGSLGALGAPQGSDTEPQGSGADR